MLDYTFHWRSAFNVLPQMLQGALVTLETAVITMVLGVLIAFALTAMRNSQSKILRGVAMAWISVARNTPSLFQIYILYFGLGNFNINISSWTALIGGIAFNNAGYLAEIFRGGMKAIPATQVRAARSLGMPAFMAYRTIVVPQLLRVVFHPLTNQMVWSVLMTSLGVVVGLDNDLTGVTQNFNVLTFRTFELFSIAAVLYYLIAKVIVLGARGLGWRLFRY
ncbi:amino acid ABC transporter permease [Tatumella citrea]|uniref:ABC transporter permease n=1 Tax=Tatumella citrea TaxID=53336 RepID=A0A1Y0L5N6_TATCI|nr:amino acid ABC transporter permease [Tatumella citrea]ARU92968.1 ABC transporter permease [Tatumella citrea]ARU97007.1 ABC transporter permease [Tatumella citrea]